MSNNEDKIPVLSFYSGGGFLDMGFEMAGFQIVWTNEYDSNFIKLHEAGISSWRKSNGNGVKAEIFNKKSITEISTKEIIKEAFDSITPKHFGIIGGPPCQDFTLHGNLNGFNGERGKLTIVFFDRILQLLPTFFVMENVTGLMKSKDTKEHLSLLLNRVKKRYHIDFKTLNALDFGVPQHRERVFFIGIRKDKIEIPKEILKTKRHWFNWPVNNSYIEAESNFKWPKAVPFGKRLKKPKDLPLELCVESCLVPYHDTNKVPNANEFFTLYIERKELDIIEEGETNRPSFKRLHRFKYSPTACYGNNEVHLHPYRHRRLSVREALRIQGVPDTYILPSNLPLTYKFKMIGNGVPVPLSKAVASSLLNFLQDNKIV